VTGTLGDRRSIVDVVVQYATGVDRRDWARTMFDLARSLGDQG